VPASVAAGAAAPAAAQSAEPHVFMRDEFTMKLEPADDQPGYLVAEFRVNGDGWHHYYGWPDAPPGTPFKFTPRGTTIKELVYGSLSAEGLSPQPWEAREPGWGTHRIEYRAIDAAGNIGDAKAFRVTIEAMPACTSTVTGTRAGDLEVTSGVTCLAPDARVDGHVTVAAGASLVGTRARIAGSLTGSGAATIELVGTTIDGSVKVTRATERLTLFGITVGGDAALDDTQTMRAALIAGSTIAGALTCTGNRSAPEGGGTTAARGMTGQCSDLTQRSAGEPFKRAGYTPDTPGLIGPRVTRQLEPRYTNEAIRQKITGTVELEVTIDSNGRVSDVRVVKSLDALYGLDESAQRLLFVAERAHRIDARRTDRGNETRQKRDQRQHRRRRPEHHRIPAGEAEQLGGEIHARRGRAGEADHSADRGHQAHLSENQPPHP
jgi:TonB family protein